MKILGSDPLELIENYQKCDAMSSSMRQKPKPRPFIFSDSGSSIVKDDAKDSRTGDNFCQSPLLKQLLVSNDKFFRVKKIITVFYLIIP